MDERATLSDLAKAELTGLEADGIHATPEEVVEINALAHDVETPATRLLLSRGRPVFLSGKTLWPYTLRAVDWLDRVTPGMDPFTQACAMGYAACFGRDDGTALDVEGRVAERAVKKWYWSLHCSRREYEEALRQLDSQENRPAPSPDPNSKPLAPGDFSAFLAAACGGDSDFWERRCSIGYAYAVMTLVVTQNAADKAPSACDPRLDAERKLGMVIDRIRKSRLEAARV